MSYYLAPALASSKGLTSEVNKKFGAPFWATVSIGDGAIGDTSHAARKSDHNPDYNFGGVVRAVDIGTHGRDIGAIEKAVISDWRTWYWIHKGIIRSRTNSFRAYRYTGSNPHNHHGHVSLQGANGVSRDFAIKVAHSTEPWFAPTSPPKPPIIFYPIVAYQFKVATGIKKGVIRPSRPIKVIQRRIGVKADGIVGPKTMNAWKAHEKKAGGRGRLAVPDPVVLRKLGIKLRFKKR